MRAELRDLRRLNTWFGGTRAVVQALTPVFARHSGRRLTFLDVGTGAGDIPSAARRVAARFGVTLRVIGVERIPAAAAVAAQADLIPVLADGGALPFPPGSVDIVCISQVLHHLPREVAVRWIAGVDRIARVAVVLADLHRTWPAMLGLWLVSFVMRLHPATRHDGVLSLRRGYTKAELTGMLREAGVNGLAYYAPIARIAAVWEPTVTSHAHR